MKLVLALALTHVVICMVCLSTINSGCQAEHVRPPGYTSSECVDDFIGDGRCDSGNNNAACDYDGGDCCECTCSEAAYYDCGEYADYDCQDPSANCGGFDHTAVHPSAFIARALSPMTEDPATQDTCSPNPCQNGGTCTMDTSGCHVCSCPMGYGGMQCQTDTTGQNLRTRYVGEHGCGGSMGHAPSSAISSLPPPIIVAKGSGMLRPPSGDRNSTEKSTMADLHDLVPVWLQEAGRK